MYMVRPHTLNTPRAQVPYPGVCQGMGPITQGMGSHTQGMGPIPRARGPIPRARGPIPRAGEGALIPNDYLYGKTSCPMAILMLSASSLAWDRADMYSEEVVRMVW